MTFQLPELPYAYEALAPYMSRETLEYHHDKHHLAYVNNGNNLLKGTEWENKSLEDIVKGVMKDYPHSTWRMDVKAQYRNMKEVIDRHPETVDYAIEAIRRAGLTPVRSSIRGGTDGSRLSFMGLPCPNIFAGEHAFHSRLEWVSRQDMEKAAETIVHLAMIWEERA